MTDQLPARERYLSDIIRLHSTLDFRSLPDHVIGDPLYVAYDPRDELITITVEDDQLPLRYLNGIMGFRLVQYLRLGWISPQLVYERAVFRETVRHPEGVQNVHTVSLCTRTGRIRGYISLGCSQDAVPLPLDDPDRGRFSTEVAHDIDLLTRFAADGMHLLLGLGRVISASEGRMRVMLGDAKEKVAIRHFRLTGFDLQVDRGTSPWLPETDLMAPIYDQDVNAVPFVAPVHADLGDYMDLIEDYLGDGPDGMTLVGLVTAMTARRTGAYRMKEAS
jgi:hypothetical protein